MPQALDLLQWRMGHRDHPRPRQGGRGLKEGDACECGPAMRAAIIELAKELGAPTYKPSEDPASAKEYPQPWMGW
jgi:hypothetical protein